MFIEIGGIHDNDAANLDTLVDKQQVVIDNKEKVKK